MTKKENTPLSGKRILLAEDSEISASLISALFRQQGVLVDWVENGALALEAMKKSAYGEYKMILMDINMPEMNGLEAAAAIRQLERPDASRTPILGFSADSPYRYKPEEAAAYGITDIIAKPIDKDGLRKIRKHLLS